MDVFSFAGKHQDGESHNQIRDHINYDDISQSDKVRRSIQNLRASLLSNKSSKLSVEVSNPYCDSVQSVTFSVGSTDKHEKLVRKKKKKVRMVKKNKSQTQSQE